MTERPFKNLFHGHEEMIDHMNALDAYIDALLAELEAARHDLACCRENWDRVEKHMQHAIAAKQEARKAARTLLSELGLGRPEWPARWPWLAENTEK